MNTREGRVVADYGRHVVVADQEGARHRCVARGRRLRAVCGDRVLWSPAPRGGAGVVEAVLPREHALVRPDGRGRPEVLAAHVDCLLVVCAPRPAPDSFLIDRYLAAAELMGADAVVVANKSDLPEAEGGSELAKVLAEIEAIGYPVLRLSAHRGDGLDGLRQRLSGLTGILVGQSGVGKSSLLNALRGDGEAAAVGELSAASGGGRHTTSAATLHVLPGGGAVIDSPGVRSYAPYLEGSGDPCAGYRELAAAAARCRFRNCRHLEEPDCGVKAGLAAGAITPRRYQSYCRLLEQWRETEPKAR